MKPDLVRDQPVARLADWHAPDCTCPSCVAIDPLDMPIGAEANRIARLIIAGFAVGLLLCVLLDLATGAHGVRVMFRGL